ncbi:MAG TPA: beta-glucosidase [Rhizomicrobium sp.]|nr:beta-glucosidase [Rhizomicrobium sp.]
MTRRISALALLLLSTVAASAQQYDPRATALVARMTPDERITLLHGYWSRPDRTHRPLPPGAEPGAGYTPAIPRLGIPALQESDASLGVSWINGQRAKGGTALPSGLALASTWDTQIAYAGSAAIAQDARASGMNVLLAGGVDLTREPRNGRNFEYLGEDPLLAGTLAGETIKGIQDQHVLSTIKHYALNAQETARHFVTADISEAAARESDLLAFEIAIERGHPGAVMCAYNRYNGPYACGSDFLLNKVLKQDWKYPGFVMSDWGAVYATDFALAGLDRQSGEELDQQEWFGAPLKALDASDPRYHARITDMNTRILSSMYVNHLFDDVPQPGPRDVARGEAAALAEAQAGIVLLKNNGLLPLLKTARTIAVVGGYANAGVMSGGGSSQVQPASGPGAVIPAGLIGEGAGRMIMLHPGAPLDAIKAAAPGAKITFEDGRYIESAATHAAKADVAIVFATQWTTESADVPDLSLPGNQDALIAAVAAANPRTVVVLETGGPVVMPWADKPAAILEAWYPGIKGGQAIADVLFGDVNPSGRLPITFPVSLDQTPRPKLDGLYDDDVSNLHANYNIEGSDVGYRWYDRKGIKPLFAFGHGLSYTSFKYDNVAVKGGDTLHISFRVTNTGARAGRDTPQVYVTDRAGKKGQRLIGWGNVDLQPGASQTVTVIADPRLLADWSKGWRVPGGQYQVTVNSSAIAPQASGQASVSARNLAP